MLRATTSLYTDFLDAPPAACVSVPFHECPSGRSSRADRDASGTASSGARGAGPQDLGSGGSAASARALLVTGTYTLDKETSRRHGSLLLHEAILPRAAKGTLLVDPGPDNAVQLFVWSQLFSCVLAVKLHDVVPLPSGSVLDIRLLPSSIDPCFPSGSNFVVASSTGQIFVYAVSTESTPSLQPISDHKVTDESTLILSLAVCPTDGLLLAATTSLSTILLLRFADKSFRALEVVAEIENVHNSIEAWTSAFSIDSRSLYSGGDDSSFAIWDVSQALSPDSDLAADESPVFPQTYRNRKIHTAGVTAILPVTVGGREYVFTGSYDQRVRVYSPTANRWLEVECDLGGGVWRLEKLPDGVLQCGSECNTVNGSIEAVWVLASCMHAGCRVFKADLVVNSNDERVEIQLVGSMTEHESMNYASAWVGRCDINGKNLQTFLSTSFYDQRVCCWGIRNQPSHTPST
ncbi:hypothetical protein DRE_04133 [Drechslerella stenobrocha 248]|uniref:methylated diphthine methylhydrolase n=1 Tax=Drechslerella stenobrocha 248 TaxID=1043628 RepID=W7HRH9_9PEZI|nr:hypothetical protein DRE_04133 [Drechslerella stenobrocha 248]